MKPRIALCLLGLLVACTRTAAPPPATPAGTASTPIDERAEGRPSAIAASPVVTPPPLSPQAPPPTFKDFPGWLGLAAVEGPSDTDAPSNALAHVALDQPDAWAALGGARLLALAPGYSEQVGYFTTQKIPFGCDGRQETFAFFKGKTRPPRGVVWLVPGGTVSVEAPRSAAVSAAVRAAGPSDLRAWTAGTRTFVSRRTDKALTSEIWEGDTRVWKDESKWEPMQGGDDVPPSLDGGPGVPIPRLLLESDDASLLVVQSDGWEGTNFTGLHLEKGSARRAEGGLYLYWCAF